MRTLRIPHFQVDDAINADEVQQVRAFGEEVAVERLQAKIAERAAEASQFFALMFPNGTCPRAPNKPKPFRSGTVSGLKVQRDHCP